MYPRLIDNRREKLDLALSDIINSGKIRTPVDCDGLLGFARYD